MAKESKKREVSLVKPSDIPGMEEIDTCVVSTVKLRICKINRPIDLAEIFTSKEKTLEPKLIADFCCQYEKFLAYAKNSFFFLAKNNTGCSVLELYLSCNKLENEGHRLDSGKILSEGVRVVLAA